MKIRVNLDETTEVKHTFIPFEVETKENSYQGTFEVIETVMHGLFLENKEYSITWNDEVPENVNEDELLSVLLEKIEGEKRKKLEKTENGKRKKLVTRKI